MDSSLLFDLKQHDDTDGKWTWSDADQKGWNFVTEEYQKFYEHWRGPDHATFRSEFPYKLSLGVDEHGGSLLPDDPTNTSENKILVTGSYNETFYRLLRLRKKDRGNRKGAILAGQPGIGKTIFLKFMLVQLISARQVVLLSNTRNDYLFYRGQVYSRSAGSGYENLPKNQLTRYSPIWALINMDYKNLGPPIEGMLNIWPIQASPPNPALWKEWKKQNRAALFGMSLWSMKELMEGLCLQPEYADFQTYLKKYLPRLNESTLRTSHDTAVDAVLEVLQAERKLMEAKDHGEIGNVIGTSATEQDEKMADERLQATGGEVDNAFEILVRNATEEFGFAPRDVYNGIFSLPATKRDHATAANNLEYSELVTLVRKFSGDGRLDGFSHRVVAVRPCPGGGDDYSVWEMTFKSIRIARKVAVLMQLREDNYLRETYHFLHGFSEGSALAGWVFEAIVHRAFCRGWSDGSAPQHIPMDSDKNDPPLFSTNRTSTPDASLSSLAPLRAHTRDVVRVNFAHGLDNVTLEDNKYYIPTATNNPLFDSFTVNRDRDTVVISIFHITVSPRYEGSTQGYLSIRKIMAHVRKLLKLLEVPNPKVEIAYFLVCPEGTSQHKWQMPAGWSKNTGFNDHKGKAFCLRIPTSVPARG